MKFVFTEKISSTNSVRLRGVGFVPKILRMTEKVKIMRVKGKNEQEISIHIIHIPVSGLAVRNLVSI